MIKMEIDPIGKFIMDRAFIQMTYYTYQSAKNWPIERACLASVSYNGPLEY